MTNVIKNQYDSSLPLVPSLIEINSKSKFELLIVVYNESAKLFLSLVPNCSTHNLIFLTEVSRAFVTYHFHWVLS